MPAAHGDFDMIYRLIPAAIFGATLMSSTAVLAFDPVVVTPDSYVTIHPNGVTDYVLATKEQTGGQFGAIILGDTKGGGGPGPAIVHTNETEIWYVLEGTFEFHVGAKVFEGGPGTFVAVDAGQPHGFITKSAGKLLTIFSPGGYEHFFMDWEKQNLTPGPDLGKLEESYGVTRPAP
jgi:mannose-6-phosphate isomerase-like protein (cupin superfamily)